MANKSEYKSAKPDIVRLSDVRCKAVPWLWKGYLADGMLSMLSGDPGAGKTFVALAIAASLSNGRVPATETECFPVQTLYLSRENTPEYVLRPRFDALKGNADHLYLLRGSIDEREKHHPSVTLKDIDIIEAALEQTAARLVVIDPLQSYLGAEVDAHRANETRPVMDGLIDLAERRGTSILLVRHLSKASGGRAVYRGLGSIDFTGAVRMEMLAGKTADDSGRRALVQIKNNVGPSAEALEYEIVDEDGDAKLEWRGASSLTAADLLSPESSSGSTTEMAEAVNWLPPALTNGPRLQEELVQESGFHVRTLQRAAKMLKLQRSRAGECGPWLWALPTT